jgi:succinate dehydrogenase hydrophobic anchor subunit
MSFRKKQDELYRHGITGFLLVPLTGWFFMSFADVLYNPKVELPLLFYSPVNTVLGICFACVALYHLNFDVKYVLIYKRDIKKEYKNILFIVYDLFSLVFAISVVVAILQLHILSILKNG